MSAFQSYFLGCTFVNNIAQRSGASIQAVKIDFLYMDNSTLCNNTGVGRQGTGGIAIVHDREFQDTESIRAFYMTANSQVRTAHVACAHPPRSEDHFIALWGRFCELARLSCGTVCRTVLLPRLLEISVTQIRLHVLHNMTCRCKLMTRALDVLGLLVESDPLSCGVWSTEAWMTRPYLPVFGPPRHRPWSLYRQQNKCSLTEEE